MKFQMLSVCFVVLLLVGCSPRLVPLEASPSSIKVKLEHAPKADVYQLHSSKTGDVVDSKRQDNDGMISFKIGQDESVNIGSCFYVSNGKNIIYVSDKAFKFENPLAEEYLSERGRNEALRSDIDRKRQALNRKTMDVAEAESMLTNSLAYRDGQCILPEVSGSTPDKPSQACAPEEEEFQASQACQNSKGEGNILCKVATQVVSTGFGYMVAGSIGAMLTGAAGKPIGDYICSDSGDCMGKYKALCRSTYNNWANEVNEIRSRPDKIRSECLGLKDSIPRLYSDISSLSSLAASLSEDLTVSDQALENLATKRVVLAKDGYCN